MLNAEQEQAIATPGHVLLAACPGSGKTRTLMYKALHELSKRDSHRDFVVAITYTHRAADEIEERIARLGVNTEQLWVGTIHSFCLEWILRPYGVYHENLGRGFQVINSHEREMILERLCKPFSSQRVTFWDCEYYFDRDQLVLSCRDQRKHATVRTVLAAYFAELRGAKQIDFELILYFAYQLIQTQPTIAKVLSNLFPSVLVDEYQDTKRIQYDIVTSIVRAGAGKSELFVVGDPNQAIFTSLGGYAIEAQELQQMLDAPLTEMDLRLNYRSTARIIEYFGKYKVRDSEIEVASEETRPSSITFDSTTHRDDLPHKIAEIVRHNVETLGIPPNELCVLAPWWMHLAGMTRDLANRLPEYDFDGPGMVPFARDIDNFWYKLAKIALTDASPTLYMRRLRWATDVLRELHAAGATVEGITNRDLLRLSNSIDPQEPHGLEYLASYFEQLCGALQIDILLFESLATQYEAFFTSSRARIARMNGEGTPFIADIDAFRRVFRAKTGITVSTIHGVKGAEFDTVIAYGLLDGIVPHFSDLDQSRSANKLMYVIGSRARRHLHLVAERGRRQTNGTAYITTPVLRRCEFDYDVGLDH